MDRRDFNLSRREMMAALGQSAMISATSAVLGSANAATSATTKDWWKSEYRILQTNLREIDAQQDPAVIARAARDFGATAIVSNIGGIVAFYPSALPLQYANPYLKGDFVGQMVDAAHANGLAYIGRFDLSKTTKSVFDAHPDWFMRNRDGSVREYEGTYQVCPNGGWAQDYALRILEEGIGRYDIDGLFFNMVGYTRTDYANVDHGICVCDNCRKKFRAMYGLDLPKTDGADDPNWLPYIAFQGRTLADLAQRTTTLVRSVRPDVPLMDFFVGQVARGEVQRRVDRPAPEWPYAMGEQVRWATGVNPKRPFSAASAAHIDYPWRQATESAANQLLRFAQALGAGGKLDLYLMGTLADQNDQSWLQPVSQLFKWHAANERHYAGLTSIGRVGLFSPASGFTGGERGFSPGLRGAYQALIDLRQSFLSLNAGRLVKEGRALTDNFDVVLVSDCRRLSDEEAAALDNFVAAGGLLITTGKTGALDAKGQPRARQILASSPVSMFTGESDAHGWSLKDEGSELDFGGAHIPVDGRYFHSRQRQGATTLLPFAPDQRFGPPEFSYAKPDATVRPDPGAVAIQFGKGMAVHIPWMPETLYYRDGLQAHRDLFGAIIGRFAPPPSIRLEGEGPVELTVQRQDGTGALMVHVINYAGQRNTAYTTPPALHGLRLGVRGSFSSAASALRTDRTIRGVRKSGDDYQWFDLPPVAAFEVLRLLPR
jgi:hypothetical protein